MQKRALAIIIGLALPLSVVFAKPYPDVPPDTLYLESIYGLQRLGVMQGNDDGTFGYGEQLNRAALLTLAYRAAKKEVRAIYYNGSFSDVSRDDWFSNVFYTAKNDGVVQGYPDGTARPASTVNLVEALKITLNALSIPLPVLTQADRLSVGGFVGTTTGAWYLPWLNAAFILDLLPDVLLEDNELSPSGPVTREVAAEILFRAMHADLSVMDDREIVENPDDDPDDNSDTNPDDDNVTGHSPPPPNTAPQADLPIHKTGKTGNRGSASFTFTIESTQTILVEATNITSQSAGLDCYLYLLGESGFSNEFFIGFKEGGTCFIRATLRAGNYQLEARSPSEGADYSIDATVSQGDGNDGFVEAISLRVGTPRTGTLTANDYEDWYKFIVPSKEPHRVKVSSSGSPSCMLFPAGNVDLSSFAVPKCGSTSDYDPGTWYISVKKSSRASDSQNYTVELR